MAEIGLLPFARLALEVGRAVLPVRRTKFSKRLFTQPQLLAVLCLMRCEDWTFREAEVRLREHAELRAALELGSVPDYPTLYRFLARLSEDGVARALRALYTPGCLDALRAGIRPDDGEQAWKTYLHTLLTVALPQRMS